jgi:hypothetical protein
MEIEIRFKGSVGVLEISGSADFGDSPRIVYQ